MVQTLAVSFQDEKKLCNITGSLRHDDSELGEMPT